MEIFVGLYLTFGFCYSFWVGSMITTQDSRNWGTEDIAPFIIFWFLWPVTIALAIYLVMKDRE